MPSKGVNTCKWNQSDYFSFQFSSKCSISGTWKHERSKLQVRRQWECTSQNVTLRFCNNVSVSPCKSFGVQTMYVLTIEGMKSVRPFFILEGKIEDSSSSALVVQKKCKTCHFASWIRRERLSNEFRWFKGYPSAVFLSLIMQIRNFSVVLVVGWFKVYMTRKSLLDFPLAWNV